MTEKYTARRKTNRWPYTVMMYILDTSALNSCILYTKKHNKEHENRLRRFELENLSCILIRTCINERIRTAQISNFTGIKSHIITAFIRLRFNIIRKISKNNEPKNGLVRCSHIECKERKNESKYNNKCMDCNLCFCKNHCDIMTTVLSDECINRN